MNSPHIPPKPVTPPKPAKPPVANNDAGSPAPAQPPQKTGSAEGAENPWLNPQHGRASDGAEASKTSKRTSEKRKRRRGKGRKKRERKPVNVPKLGWYLFAITMLGACVAALALG
ncbi:hypothetical protein [uncultured Brevibacterium sp.]|uniref:hypothetical protein n=1 Tax=uncultured Brevibacterium sp. TaxID=189678 RepID=UPI0025F6F341|nr:hypothetical protein [uncultured Brevibacterium sp.]